VRAPVLTRRMLLGGLVAAASGALSVGAPGAVAPRVPRVDASDRLPVDAQPAGASAGVAPPATLDCPWWQHLRTTATA